MKTTLRRILLAACLGHSLFGNAQRPSDGNPVLPEFHADPEILYARQTNRFYLYSTTDGAPGWGGYYFTVFSSKDLTDWRHEGIMLDLGTDQVSWSDGNAWAPCIIEKKTATGYKYFFYYSGNTPLGKAIGVATADHPTGPFTDAGHPIVDKLPEGQRHGQQIDVDVFEDPVSGKNYLYWGNGYMAGAELDDDMLGVKPETVKLMTPQGGSLQDHAYREAPYVFYRNGLYYFLWSVDDTGSPNYHVAYGTSTSPLGPITVATQPVILIQRPEDEIYGTAHNAVLQIPGTDDWYMVYHRINKHYMKSGKGPGYHREVCIDRMFFNPDGTICPVQPTHTGVAPVKVKKKHGGKPRSKRG
ncbi:MAG: family 43 glycosylhydrolase [Clostridium sp.]|nr:family 43 glycosylhydrolase [Clostridium sp.]